MKKNIFLSGPMRGIPRELSLGWRKKATELLKNRFNVFHAFRGREEKETFSDPRLAVSRDLNDILSSHIVLINDTVENCSMIGTSMEIFFAHQQKKTLIAFGNAHSNDYWLNYHIHCRVETLEEACEIINNMFL